MLTFTLTVEQEKKIAEFHPNCKHKYTGAIGGGFEYLFHPTGIGCAVEFKCVCGKTLDVTDYDGW